MATEGTPAFTRRAHAFTLNRVFLGDTILNWFLGAVLTFFPRFVDRVLSFSPPMLPPVFYILLGVIFLGFSAWQTSVLVRQRMGPPALIFAGVMALLPFIGLTAGLLFLDLSLKPLWRVILWIGDIYMLLLGIWYLYLARRVREDKPTLPPD